MTKIKNLALILCSPMLIILVLAATICFVMADYSELKTLRKKDENTYSYYIAFAKREVEKYDELYKMSSYVL